MKNELEKIKKKYFKQNTRYGYYSKRIAHTLLDAIKNAKENDAPDFYYLKNNTCYLFEHFEFDASQKSNNKGSFFKRQEKEADKIIDIKTKERLSSKKAKENEITSYGAFSTGIKSNYQKEFWKNNFIDTFSKHYKKLDKYKTNLLDKKTIDKNTNIKNIFVIEDTTEFGAFESIESNRICLPCDFDFGIDILIKSKDIDYFVFLNEAQQIIFIVNRTALKIMKKNCLNFDKTKMFFFNNIQVVSALVAIPDSLMKNNNSQNTSPNKQ